MGDLAARAAEMAAAAGVEMAARLDQLRDAALAGGESPATLLAAINGLKQQAFALYRGALDGISEGLYRISDPDELVRTVAKRLEGIHDEFLSTGRVEVPAPTVTSPAAVIVAENQTAVQTVTGRDTDAGTMLTYAISGGPDQAKFTIDSATGVLTFLAAPNFESPTDAGADNVYDLTVQVRDGSLTATQAVTVTVRNVNEAPTDIAVPVTSVAENSPLGTVVGTLSAVDPDAGDSFTYEFVEGEGAADNALFAIDGDALEVATPLNFELRNSYSVRIRARDAAGAATEKAFAVSVSDAPSEVLKVERVTPPAAGVYRAGQALRFTVELSNTAVVRGRPRIQMGGGSAPRLANYVGGTGTARLTFQYVVTGNDDLAVVELGTRFVFPAGAFVASGTQRLAAALPTGIAGIPAPGVRLDPRAPVARMTTGPVRGTYRVGQSLDFLIRFSEPVFVTGTPWIGLSGLTLPQQATYVSGSGSAALIFRYVVQAGDALRPKRALALGKTIVVQGRGKIADEAGNPAVLAIRPPSLQGVLVRHGAPPSIRPMELPPASLDG